LHLLQAAPSCAHAVPDRLLGGCFRGVGTWGVCETSYISGGKFLDTTLHLTEGMHELPRQSYRAAEPSQMRWAMCVAYYIRPGVEAQLIHVVDHPRQKKLFKSPDVFLAPFTKYLLWPPACGDQGAQSLCSTHKKDLGTDLYCSYGMREVVARMNRPVPPPGRSTVDVLNWQIRESKAILEKARSHQAQLAKAT